METVLSIRQASRAFAVRRGLLGGGDARLLAVNKVSLDIYERETLGLVGESGCGKSTLARMAVRLLRPSAGSIQLKGRNLRDWPARELAREAQMVFQDPFSSLNPRLSVGASIREPLLLALRQRQERAGRAELRRRVEAMLEKVGLDPLHYARYPHEFSGGQRQRVAVARALIGGAKFLVCDEPVSALDASVQAQVLNLLKDMQSGEGLTCLFISHDLAVVGSMSDRVAVMYLGEIVELADREDLFRQAAHPYTQALLAAVPARDPARRRERAALSGEAPSPLAPPQGCAFHPRCPRARPLCSQSAPAWQEIFPRHWTRCHVSAR